MQALACYIKQEDKIIDPDIRYFIEENLKKMDYSHLLERRKLYTQGMVYNLQRIYHDLNKEYFDNRLNLFITWFGKPNFRCRTRVTFGLYHDPLKLIKINRLLDSPSFPDYLVSYVVYHEMLHHVCPAYHDENGVHRIHTKEFKKRESQFRHFNLAQDWIRDHQQHLFKGAF